MNPGPQQWKHESNHWTGREFPSMHRIHADSFSTHLEQAGWFIRLRVWILLKETPKKPPNFWKKPLRNPQTVFQIGCTNFVFPSTENDGSRCSTSSPAVGGVSVLDLRHPIGYVVVHYSSFHLQFPSNLWGSASLGMFIRHLCVLDEVTIKIFCPFFNWIVLFSCW